MRTYQANLQFLKSGVGLIIPFHNNPIRQMQINLVKDWKHLQKQRANNPFMMDFNPRQLDVDLIVETDDTQLSWKNLDEKILMSKAILSLPLITKDTYGPSCDFKGWLIDFTPNSHFTFQITDTINGSDKITGIKVYNNTISIWTDSFPEELWALYD